MLINLKLATQIMQCGSRHMKYPLQNYTTQFARNNCTALSRQPRLVQHIKNANIIRRPPCNTNHLIVRRFADKVKPDQKLIDKWKESVVGKWLLSYRVSVFMAFVLVPVIAYVSVTSYRLL